MYSKPMLSPGFLDWVKNNDFKNSNILEIGSGNSTLFFSKYFKQVYSFEDNKEWFNNLILKGLPFNVDLQLFDVNIFKDLNFQRKVFESNVILIDNNPNNIPREEFTYFIHKNKNPNSIIILDNGDWNYCAYEFLRSHYYCHDFLRKDPTENFKITQTTIFYHPRIKN